MTAVLRNHIKRSWPLLCQHQPRSSDLTGCKCLHPEQSLRKGYDWSGALSWCNAFVSRKFWDILVYSRSLIVKVSQWSLLKNRCWPHWPHLFRFWPLCKLSIDRYCPFTFKVRHTVLPHPLQHDMKSKSDFCARVLVCLCNSSAN